MNWCILAITDGRRDGAGRLLSEISRRSAEGSLPLVRDTPVIVVDDSAHKLGFSGAIQHGWERVRELDRKLRMRGSQLDYVFHVEDDFVFLRPVPLHQMAMVLEAHSHIAQIALLRQPWNEEERAAGGIIQANPDDFEQRARGGISWVEHRRFWTTNPSLYAASWCYNDWPQQQYSEGIWTHKLLREPELRFAFWGMKDQTPAVLHIGAERAGHGY